MTELVAKSATELRRLIGSRQLSPVELMDACIARIEAFNPAVNASPPREPRHEVTPPNPADVARLIAEADGENLPLGCFLRLAATSGARYCLNICCR